MSNRWVSSLMTGTLLLFFTGCVVAPAAVESPPPTPPAQAEVAPPTPGPAYVWVPGHWAWRGPYRGYVWIPGHWTIPGQAGYMWVPGHWERGPGGYLWVEGHWRAR